jgi:hypothetical protein
MKRMLRPARMPKKVNAPDWVWMKYVAFTKDLPGLCKRVVLRKKRERYQGFTTSTKEDRYVNAR